MAKRQRPRTQAELAKAKDLLVGDTVIVQNACRQMIPIQVVEPGQDFYVGQKSVPLGINKSVRLNYNAAIKEQLDTLSKRGLIRYRIIKA